MTDLAPGRGARAQHHRRVAARLRRLQAAGASPEELRAALDDEPASERAWRRGAEGEERLGALLGDWAGTCGTGVLHDLVIPGRGGANIDHVVVGPGGAFVIDAKAWAGAVDIRATGVWTGRWGHRRALEGIREQVAVVHGALRAAGAGDAPVTGVLCLVDDNPGTPRGELLRVHGVLVGGRAAVAQLTVADGPLTDEEITQVFRALDASMPARGGARPPSACLRGASAPHVADAPARGARRSGSPRSSTPRRRARSRGRRRGLAVDLCLFVAGLGALGAVLEPSPGPPRRSTPVSAAEVATWVPDLDRRVRATTSTPLRTMATRTTEARIHLRLRGPGCALRISINRWTARTAADAVIVPGAGC